MKHYSDHRGHVLFEIVIYNWVFSYFSQIFIFTLSLGKITLFLVHFKFSGNNWYIVQLPFSGFQAHIAHVFWNSHLPCSFTANVFQIVSVPAKHTSVQWDIYRIFNAGNSYKKSALLIFIPFPSKIIINSERGRYINKAVEETVGVQQDYQPPCRQIAKNINRSKKSASSFLNNVWIEFGKIIPERTSVFA